MQSIFSKRINAVYVVCGALVVGSAILIRLPFLGYHYDDAMITFRYAQNLAAGDGFAFNHGERVLGTSTPLFTIVMAGISLCRLPAPEACDSLNIVFQILACLTVYTMLARYAGSATGIVGALVLAWAPDYLVSAGSGMETSLYILLILLSFYLYFSERYGSCWIMCGFLSLTRPEGFLVPLIIFIDALTRADRRRRLQWSCGFFAIVAAWALFASIYFGSPIPASISAKLTIYKSNVTPLTMKLLRIAAFHKSPLGLAALLFFIVGLRSLHRYGRELPLLGVWLLLYSLPLLMSRTYIFPWYYTPATVLYLVIAALGASAVSKRIGESALRGRKAGWSVKLLLSALALLIGYQWGAAIVLERRRRIAVYNNLDRQCRAAGRWLKENTDPSSLICAGDIGYIGFLSGRRILDYVGLVSPEAVDYNRRGDTLGLFKKYLPDYITGGDYGNVRETIIHQEWFREHYVLIKTFRRKGSVKWFVFRRRDPRAAFTTTPIPGPAERPLSQPQPVSTEEA